MTKNDIFNFNHIDPNIDTEKLKQIQDLFAYYHKITWIYHHSHKPNKKINYTVNVANVLLASVGIITGGITPNPIVLGTLTTAGILLKSYFEFKNIKSKTNLLKKKPTNQPCVQIRTCTANVDLITVFKSYHIPCPGKSHC